MGALLALVLAVGLGAYDPIAGVGFTAVGFAVGSVLAEMFRSVRARAAVASGWGSALRLAWLADRRRYAAHLVHLAVLIMVAGLIGSSLYKAEYQMVLRPGESIRVQDYLLTYRLPLRGMDQARQQTAVLLELARGGRTLGTLVPERNFYWNVRQVVSEVAVRSTLREDFYVTLAALQDDDRATLQVQITPLVGWLWAGGVLLFLGAVAGLWPVGVSSKRAAEGDPS